MGLCLYILFLTVIHPLPQLNWILKVCENSCLSLFIWNHCLRLLQYQIENRLNNIINYFIILGLLLSPAQTQPRPWGCIPARARLQSAPTPTSSSGTPTTSNPSHTRPTCKPLTLTSLRGWRFTVLQSLFCAEVGWSSMSMRSIRRSEDRAKVGSLPRRHSRPTCTMLCKIWWALVCILNSNVQYPAVVA